MLILSAVCYHSSIAQTGKISYTISNGLQIAGVDGTNPVIYDNDMLMDTPEDQFLWLKAHNGEVNLVGNINTRDMYACTWPEGCRFTHQSTFDDWLNAYSVVTQMGLRNIPAPVKGSGEALIKPGSGRIEDTQFNVSVGSELILSEARKASPSKPLVMLVGGNVTSIANAYLKDPSIIDRVVVLHVDGWRGHGGYNTTDNWATYIVMKRMKYVVWDGDLNGWYFGKSVNITQDMINRLPSNPFANTLKSFFTDIFSIFHDVGDGPPIFYFFNHGLWKNVQRRTEDNQPTTSDTYDFLIVSENNWSQYGPDMMNYMTDASKYSTSPSNALPSVNITSPSNNASFNVGSSITITANASDADGSIQRVEFYNGSTKIGEDLTNPYSFVWSSVNPGNYNITAKATDNIGATKTSSAISISIQANAAPNVTLTSPSNNASFTPGSSITISANASDADGSISKVEFYSGTTKLGEDATNPYSFVWASVPAGNYTLTAKAFDNLGAVTSSAAASVSVQAVNVAPTVNLTSPSNNATFTPGSSVTITAIAADTDGSVSKVEFYNGTTKLGEDITSPYSFTWPSVAVGNYSISARAIDNVGVTTNSAAVSISVMAGNVSPVVNITSPANAATFTTGSTITITANASDSDGSVSKVEFFRGTVKLGEDLTSPFSFSWNSATAGTHSISAKATDNLGAVITSASISISVQNPNVAPAVTLTSPVNNADFPTNSSITLTANASDTDGSVSKVEFFNGSIKLGEDLTTPYNFVWNTVPNGNYILIAKATDNQNSVTASAGVNITVKATPIPPVVDITSPENGSSFAAGSTVSIAVTATSSTGSVIKTEFFNGSTKLGEDLTSPYNFDWINVTTGNYTISVKATTNQGLTATDAIQFSVRMGNVTPPGNPPIAQAGEDISVQLSTTPITINGSGTDVDGEIAKYTWTLISGPEEVAITQSLAGELTLTNLSEGNYVFGLTVTDDDNLTGSDEVTVTILPVPLAQNIPRFFSPNNDGVNDVWEWPNIDLYENSPLIIFNRFGQTIFETTSYQNNWNGTIDGKPLQEDAYYYSIKISNTDIRGAVRIVR